jgi:hypothetical protein
LCLDYLVHHHYSDHHFCAQLIAALSVRGVDQHHLSQTHVTKLPALRKHHCAVVVQKNVRMWLARRKYACFDDFFFTGVHLINFTLNNSGCRAKQAREGRKLLEKHARDRLKQQQRRAAAEKLQEVFRKYLEWRAKIEAKIVEVTKKNAAKRIQVCSGFPSQFSCVVNQLFIFTFFLAAMVSSSSSCQESVAFVLSNLQEKGPASRSAGENELLAVDHSGI